MRAQTRYLPEWFRYFAGLADKLEGRVIPIDRPGFFNFTLEEPLGVIAAIVPWNSPLMLAGWKMAPALAAGNTFVWKPSEHSSVSALEMADLFAEAGLPPGVVNIVTGFGNEIGDALVTHKDVAKIAFTGGDATGALVYQAAAKHLKPVTMELGGKSANIVFADANLDNAVKGVVSGIFAATGQTCVAGSRALIHRSIHDEFVERFLEARTHGAHGQSARGDDAGRPDHDEAAVREGARLHRHREATGRDLRARRRTRAATGARRRLVRRADGVHRRDARRCGSRRKKCSAPCCRSSRSTATRKRSGIANDSIYGLAAGVWTSSIGRALKMAHELEAGTVWTNTYRVSSPLSPFGGYKRSGFGRESGLLAIREFVQEKSVWIETSGADTPNPFVIR